MKDGFIRAAAASIDVTVANPEKNAEKILEAIEEAKGRDVKILVLPELVLTAYTCGDLFLQRVLLEEALKQLDVILDKTKDTDMLIVLGMPLRVDSKLYNCAVFIHRGTLLGIVPKRYLPNYSEFYEARHFTPGKEAVRNITVLGRTVPFGMNLLFCCENLPELVVAAELCEDLWVPAPPSVKHALAGATVICNPSASDEIVAKMNYRQGLVSSQSAHLVCAYIYASAGNGESTQDVVYGGHNLIAENGTILSQSKLFSGQCAMADLDLSRLTADRQRATTFEPDTETPYLRVPFCLETVDLSLARTFSPTPFIPSDRGDRDIRCEDILSIQAMGLKKRLQHTHCSHTVIGISGGLDSTLALLVTARAYDLLGLDHSGIHCVTMPCFGTTDRTYQNALKLTDALGASLKEVRISAAVMQHFSDIGHDPAVHDVTYENSQARERTQILMDIANQVGGLVIGTGDLSELALGWATYNGDHMSMYAVNSSVPKTLVRHLVRYCADCADQALKTVLMDVLNTPVSPELLPPENGVISQITEDIVGPYELHDFFLYYTLRFGFPPRKIFRMAQLSFAGVYNKETIYKWLRTFYYRFFSQQFKRSCLPDGPKVGSIAISPRGDLRMPSDADSALWMHEMDSLK